MFGLQRFDPEKKEKQKQEEEKAFNPLERLSRRLEQARGQEEQGKEKEKEKEQEQEQDTKEELAEQETHHQRPEESPEESRNDERPLSKRQKARIELGFTGANSIPLPAQDGAAEKKAKTTAKIKYLKKKKARTKSRKQLLRQSTKKDEQLPVRGEEEDQEPSQSTSNHATNNNNAPPSASLIPSTDDPKKRVKRPKNLDSALEKITKKKIKTDHVPKDENNPEGEEETKKESKPDEEEKEGQEGGAENTMIIAQPGALPRFPAPVNSSRPDPRLLARLAMGLGYPQPSTSSSHLTQDFIHFESQNVFNLDQIHLRPSSNSCDSTLTIDSTPAPFSLSVHSVNRLNQLGFKSLLAVQTAVLSILMPSLSMHEKTPGTNLYPTRNPPRDLCVNAPTGSGKTLSYIIPIIETLKSRLVCRIRALIVLPTRDLVLQVKNTFDTFSSGTGLKAAILTGHHSFSREQALVGGNKGGLDGTVDVVIATPGRLLDHLTYTPGFSTDHLCFLVLDEADQLLKKNSQNWLQQILNPTKINHDVLDSQHLFNSSNQSDLFDQKQEQEEGVEFLNHQDAFLPDVDDLCSALSKPKPAPQSLWTLPVETCNPCRLRPFRILLFSATLKRDPTQVDHLGLRNPIFIKVSSAGLDSEQDNTGTTQDKQTAVADDSLDHWNGFSLPSTLKQHIIVTRTDLKPLVFINLVITKRIKKALCFCKSIEGAERLTSLCKLIFEDQDSVNAIHTSLSTNQSNADEQADSFAVDDLFKVECFSSDLSPTERSKLLKSFQLGQINMLICSDMIARGMDIASVENVINYDAPIEMKKYVHRVGRTARAHQVGSAFTLIESQEAKFIKGFLKLGLGASAYKHNIVRLRFTWFHLNHLDQVYQVGLKKLAQKYARSIDL